MNSSRSSKLIKSPNEIFKLRMRPARLSQRAKTKKGKGEENKDKEEDA